MPFTSNEAKVLKLDREVGFVKEGYIVNLLLLDENLDINVVISECKFMMKNKKI